MSRTEAGPPRVPPGSRAQIGVVNALIARTLGAATGGPPPNLFTTLARHRRLFRAWLCFAAALMPGGALPRADSELVILRVAHLCDCAYEWRHHTHLAQRSGLSAADVAAVREGPDPARFSARQAALLAATDELHETRSLSDETWQRLGRLLAERERIELPMLVGHYQMLALTLATLRVQPDPPPAPSRRPVARLARRVTDRR